MKPINVAERRSTFFIFLFFFILSTSLVVLTIFFGMKVPSKENELMKAQIDAFQKEEAFKQKFADRLSLTWAQFDKRSKASVPEAIQMDAKIRLNIDTLNMYVGSDTTSHMEIYRNVVASLYSLAIANKGLSDKGSNAEELNSLKQDLRAEKDRADRLQQAYNDAALRASGH